MNSRTDTRVDGLEKAVAELKWRSQRRTYQFEDLRTTLDELRREFRASLAAHLRTSPTPSNNTAATLPTVTAPLLPYSPPTPTPATPPTLAPMTAPLLSSCTIMPQFQPSVLPLLQRCDPAAAADHAKLLVSSGPPTTTMVSTPRLSSSPNIQLQPLRDLVLAAAHQSMQSIVSLPDPPYAAVDAPFSHQAMLLFLHIVGHLLWFNALATTQKYEFEPPPDEVLRV
ncbi:max-binding protein MNT-like [Salvia splendens]|uniref:max-binding protein MNT-like n=1 Tax=Salvia splendens TaxID=180675 RepID=UPI001C25D8D6|nr:max-binding protein MNT-like [Salvia splendens]